MKSAPMMTTHDEMNLSDVEEELELLGVEESMSLLCFSNEGSKGDDGEDDSNSVDLAGFFSDGDDENSEEETYETVTDTEDIVGDESDHYFKSGSDSLKSIHGGHAGKAWKRRPCPNALHKKPSNACAAGASVVSGLSSPQSGDKSPSQPIDIVYGCTECRDKDFKKSTYTSRAKARRNLFRNREDWREKAWQRKTNQVLSEEMGYSDNYSDSQSSKTTHDSCGEEARNSPSAMKHGTRTKNFTNVDLDELKGCLDLGFGFNYEEMPELSNTLPALELCYVMGQKFQDDNHQKSSPVSTLDNADSTSSDGYAQSPIAQWKISSPGDHPQQVKERLKVWAQAVACTVRLCST
uniref:Uncharacterized protein n=1 Tax=Araucaria cunninghamii TaxID=56994 RepID=A0A0D6QYL1_ARACU